MIKKKKLKLLVLGGNGMVGHVLLNNLKNFHEVKATLKNKKENYINLNNDDYFDKVNLLNFSSVKEIIIKFNPEIIINAAGITKQRINEYEPSQVIIINSIFPHKLAKFCHNMNIRLIHLSTDCVFSGKKGFYGIEDKPDAEDLYGKSKIDGEIKYPNTLTLRKSTIGFELDNKKGLLEWLIKQSGEINGFTNAIYSGVTSLELSRIILFIIENKKNLEGIYHVSSKPIDKYTLLKKLKDKFRLNSVSIKPYKDFTCDRSLDGKDFIKKTGYQIPDWDEMIDNLIEYNN